MTQDQYLIVIVILTIVNLVLWCWLAVIKYQESRSWHSYGCLIYAITYFLLAYRNISAQEHLKIIIDSNYLLISYFAYLGQIGACISFILNSYTKDHVKKH